MEKKFEFIIDEQLEKKFKIALMLTDDNVDELFANWILQYVQTVFTKEAGVDVKEEKSENKLVNKIRKWAMKDNVPSRIIKAFLLCCDTDIKMAKKIDVVDNFVKIHLTEENMENGEQLRKKFNINYPQMKTDGAHAHGKVFYDNGEYIYLVEEIKDEIIKLKEKFLK